MSEFLAILDDFLHQDSSQDENHSFNEANIGYQDISQPSFSHQFPQNYPAFSQFVPQTPIYPANDEYPQPQYAIEDEQDQDYQQQNPIEVSSIEDDYDNEDDFTHNSHSERTSCSSYIKDSYITPSPPPRHVKRSINYLTSLPDRVRSVFNFESFNGMQTEAFPDIYENTDNCVISSPTGSGKTVLFELAILRLFIKDNDIALDNNMKVLYIGPTKALCTERYEDWKKKFASLNITVGLLTSDTNSFETESVKRSNIIITTPEKWDLLSRRWFDFLRIFDLVKLLLIDEIHILNDNRGSTLEVVTTRMRRLCSKLRIIALSATVPNIEDVSNWLKKRCKNTVEPATTLVFGEEYRSVKLQRFVFGIRNSSNKNIFQFDFMLNNKLIEVIRQRSQRKPVLIFCSTRKIAQNTAQCLKDNLSDLLNHNKPQNIKVQSKDIRRLAENGIAYHHAGLSYQDRVWVENNFINGKIKYLCCTSTLAMGVNLPAFLVIIKGTLTYNQGKFSEYNDLDVLQMVGRAGRPQFEKTGIAVILTEEKNKNLYERMVEGKEKLESCLHLNFHENLVAEVCLGTVTDIESAVDWLSSTFFYTRYRSNPTAYSEIQGLNIIDLDTRLAMFCERQLEYLKESQIVDFDLLEKKFKTTPYGDAMSKHYVLLETIKSFINCDRKRDFFSVFELLCKSKELCELKMKYNERRLFKEISSSSMLKFPPPKIINNNFPDYLKAFILLQYELGGLEFPSYKGVQGLCFSFNSEKLYIFKQVPRLIKCMVDTFIQKKDSVSLLNALKLGRSIAGKCWEDSAMMLKQLEGIGIKFVRLFINNNITDFTELLKLSGSRIEYYLGMRPGQGLKILKDAENIPNFSINCQFISYDISKDLGSVNVTFSIQVKCPKEKKITHWHKKFLMANIVTEISDGTLLDFRRIPCGKLDKSKKFMLNAKIFKKNQIIRAHISCESIANSGTWAALPMKVPDNVFDKLVDKVVEAESENDLTVINDDLDSDVFSDDEEFEKLILKPKVENKEGINVVNNATPYKKRADGGYECKHTCKDKTKCRHICCREGLPSIPKKKITSKDFRIENNEQISQKSNKIVEVAKSQVKEVIDLRHSVEEIEEHQRQDNFIIKKAFEEEYPKNIERTDHENVTEEQNKVTEDPRLKEKPNEVASLMNNEGNKAFHKSSKKKLFKKKKRLSKVPLKHSKLIDDDDESFITGGNNDDFFFSQTNFTKIDKNCGTIFDKSSSSIKIKKKRKSISILTDSSTEDEKAKPIKKVKKIQEESIDIPDKFLVKPKRNELRISQSSVSEGEMTLDDFLKKGFLSDDYENEKVENEYANKEPILNKAIDNETVNDATSSNEANSYYKGIDELKEFLGSDVEFS